MVSVRRRACACSMVAPGARSHGASRRRCVRGSACPPEHDGASSAGEVSAMGTYSGAAPSSTRSVCSTPWRSEREIGGRCARARPRSWAACLRGQRQARGALPAQISRRLHRRVRRLAERSRAHNIASTRVGGSAKRPGVEPQTYSITFAARQVLVVGAPGLEAAFFKREPAAALTLLAARGQRRIAPQAGAEQRLRRRAPDRSPPPSSCRTARRSPAARASRRRATSVPFSLLLDGADAAV